MNLEEDMEGVGGGEEEAIVIIDTMLMYKVLKNQIITFKKKTIQLNIKIGKVMDNRTVR